MAGSENTHERLTAHEEVKTSSDRAFGIVFCVVFLLIGLWPLFSGGGVRWWSLGLAAGFLAVALARPALLAPLNRLWTRFGLLLHKIVNPLVMGLLFFFVVTPIGLLMGLLGKRPLDLQFEHERDSYWIARTPPGPPPDGMTNQF
jgi:hypothetical protein